MRSGAALFPGGLTGAGLFVLRIAIAISAVVLAAKSSFEPHILQWLGIVTAVGLCAGFQTRALASLSLLASLLGVVTAIVPAEMALLHAISAVSLTLTGPGAFSADARLFGRRTITLPDRDGSNTVE